MTTETLSPRIAPLRAAVQNYAWGLPADEGSLVARMHALNSGAPITPSKPYAELWIGTHASGPAHVIAPGDPTLAAFLTNNKLDSIPYLLKILSVAKPLSIQAHPHKELAKQLHQKNPSAYKDDNHKPEMCVALTEFEGLCNFRPIGEILSYLQALPDLSALCNGQATTIALSTASTEKEKRSALGNLFSTLMNSSEESITAALHSVVENLESQSERADIENLFLRLVRHYPGDVGCFAAFLLNYVRIKPGQAFFMAANEPHAYLLGQCIEIMACSDNVVRAGLTPKFKDVSTLIDMLTYQDAPPTIMEGSVIDDYSVLYQPPADEFQLIKYNLPAGKTHKLPALKGPGMLLCLDGTGWISLSNPTSEGENENLPLAAGRIYYVADSTALVVQAKKSAVSGAPSPDLCFFRASVNQKVQ